jgi:hypothetical protein
MLKLKLLIAAAALLGLAGCDTNPPMRHVTANGTPCHPIGL